MTPPAVVPSIVLFCGIRSSKTAELAAVGSVLVPARLPTLP